MSRDKIIKILSGLLTVNQEERQAVQEAIRIIKETTWRDATLETVARR